MNGFVLLSGTMRSGTSLLGELLYSRSKGRAMHPDLSFANDNFDTLRQWLRAAAEIACPDCPARRVMGPLAASPEQLAEALEKVLDRPAEKPIVDVLVDGILRAAPLPSPPRRIGVKATGLVAEFDLLRQVFPEARFLVCMRDPRDVLASNLLRCGQERRFDAEMILADIANLHLFLQQRGDDPAIHQVRYEDLVRDPRTHMETVLEFVGLDPGRYHWDLLASQDIGSNSSYLPHHGMGWIDGGGIRTDSVGRFEKVLSEGQVALVEALLAPMMKASGYTPTAEVRTVGGDPSHGPLLLAMVRRCRVRGVCQEGLKQIGTIPDYPGLEAEVDRREEMADILVKARDKPGRAFLRVLGRKPAWPLGGQPGRRDLRAIRKAARAGSWEQVEDGVVDLVAGEQRPDRKIRMTLAVLAQTTNWRKQVAYIDWKLQEQGGFDPFLSLRRLGLVLANARGSRARPHIDAFWQAFDGHVAEHGPSDRLERTRDQARKLLAEAGLA